mgnify:CR=1 FL=1
MCHHFFETDVKWKIPSNMITFMKLISNTAGRNSITKLTQLMSQVENCVIWCPVAKGFFCFQAHHAWVGTIDPLKLIEL